MKLLIIIATILLTIYTAQAEWVKSGELDSLYLQNSEVSFSKYSPDYTKFVTYSRQDSTLRLFDLATGTIIKQRTFDWSYNYDLCEFDFEREKFYMVKNKGKIYPGSVETKLEKYNIIDKNNRIWNIDFKDTLSFINIIPITIFVLTEKYPTVIVTSYKCNLLVIKSSAIEMNYEVIEDTYNNVSSDHETGYTSYFFKSVSINKTNNKTLLHKTELFDVYKYYKFNSSSAISYYKSNNLYCYQFNFKDTLENFPNFEVINKVKNYPLFSDGMIPLDINYNTLVYKNTANNLFFYNKEADQIVDYGIPVTPLSIRNFKLVSSPKYSIFFKELNKLYLCDNIEKKFKDSINIPEGVIGFEKTNKYVYSNVENVLYRNSFLINLGEFADIWTERNRYLYSDSVEIKTNLPTITNLKITVDNTNYYEKEPVLFNLNKGYHNVKLFYTENGIKRVITKDSLFNVVDSIKFTIKVTNPNNNIANMPFTFEATSNFDNCDYSWSYYYPVYPDPNQKEFQIQSQKINSQKASFTISLIGDTTGIKLNCNNGIQDTNLIVKFEVKPYLNAKFSAYTGIAPFKFNIVFDKTYLRYNGKYGATFVNIYSFKDYKIGDILRKRSSGLVKDSVFETISIPGVYPIQLISPNHLGDYIVTLDSVITVLAPSDIKELVTQNYLFRDFGEMAFIKSEDLFDVEVYDIVGRNVKNYTGNKEILIRKEEFERGVYFARISISGISRTEKFLVD